ncbi:MAG: hypothetical protein ACRDPC_28325 [Solirubrobacteraceae bacterium]
MPRAIALLAAALLAIAVAGCGGDDPLAPQAPGPPAGMPVPEAEEPPGGGTADDATQEDAATEDGATTEPDATVVPPEEETGAAAPAAPETAVAPEESGGGATAPDATADGPTNDTPPPAGSDAEQFEDFCAQNPGAC